MSEEISKVENRGRGRPPGQPKTGGRTKGTPNKNSQTFRKALDEVGFNIVEAFIEAVRELEPAQQVAALTPILRYIYPQLKEIEPPADDAKPNDTAALDTQNLIELAKK